MHCQKLVFALASLAIFITLSMLTASPAAADTKKVTIDATCPSDTKTALEVTVNPWTLDVAQGDEVEWSLTTNAPSNSIEIEAKDRGHWPFKKTRHAGQGKAFGRDMKPNAKGSYGYNILVLCGENAPVVIDPRIKVG